MSIVKGENTKRLLLIIAGLLVIGAILVQSQIDNNDEITKILTRLSGFGYYLSDESLYIQGDYPNMTIASMLQGIDLEEAVAASKKAGFPSRIDKQGDVVLILAATREQDVITLYMLDGEMELCFIQRPNSSKVAPLGAEEP